MGGGGSIGEFPLSSCCGKTHCRNQLSWPNVSHRPGTQDSGSSCRVSISTAPECWPTQGAWPIQTMMAHGLVLILQAPGLGLALNPPAPGQGRDHAHHHGGVDGRPKKTTTNSAHQREQLALST